MKRHISLYLILNWNVISTTYTLKNKGTLLAFMVPLRTFSNLKKKEKKMLKENNGSFENFLTFNNLMVDIY